MTVQGPPWGEILIEDNGVAGVYSNGVHWNNYEKKVNGVWVLTFETWDPSKPASRRHKRQQFVDPEEHRKAVLAAWEENNE